jgi:L-rhamnose mutarotase
MKRIGFKMYLKPGFETEYKKRHDELWPELEVLLREQGVFDYSIYWDKDTNILFASQKLKGEADSQKLGTHPIVQRWWDYMADIMETNQDRSPVTESLIEVFFLE